MFNADNTIIYFKELLTDIQNELNSEKIKALLDKIFTSHKFDNAAQGIISGLVYLVGATVVMPLLLAITSPAQAIIALLASTYFAYKACTSNNPAIKQNNTVLLALSAATYLILPNVLALIPTSLAVLMAYKTYKSYELQIDKAVKGFQNELSLFYKSVNGTDAAPSGLRK